MAIDLEETVIGDEVSIRDRGGNLVNGPVEGTEEQRWVTAFGTRIVFSNRAIAGRWRAVKGITVVGHIPAMFPAGVGRAG
jgi:hypothetical protein